MKKTIYILLIILSIVNLTYAQIVIDTVLVDEIKIIGTKLNTFNTGYKSEYIDTILTKNLINHTLTDLLELNNTIYLKNYGAGNLATPSLRGTGANHTAVVWNGINLQSNMNGTLDLSLVPISGTDEIYLQYGASSSLYGSGAIGGSININNKPKFNKGKSLSLSTGIGSFQTIPINFNYLFSNNKFCINIKPFLMSSKNNFYYYIKNDSITQRKHNEYFKQGITTEIYYQISNSQLVSLKFWQQTSDRNLAPSLSQTNLSQTQKDESIRFVLEWNKHFNRLDLTFKSAYLHDFLNYKDSSTNINSDYKSNSNINEFEVSADLTEKQIITLGLNNTYNNAFSENYPSKPSMNKAAIFATYKLSLNKFNLSVSARKEFIAKYSSPLVPSIGTELKILKSLILKGNFAGCYRIPTFNDLYWQNSGNQNLKPEKGYQIDFGLLIQKNIFTKYHLMASTNLYNSLINDWIIWLPNGSFWTPQNLVQVYSRGVESNFKLSYTNKKIITSISTNTNYRISTNEKAKFQNDESLGKQLIYVPMYSFAATYVFQYKNKGIVLNQTYNGYRYTSSDNTQFIPPYTLTNIHAYYNYISTHYNIKISLLANNILNTDYQTIQAYPMPLANYQFNLTLNI